jgi:hypothetical protein
VSGIDVLTPASPCAELDLCMSSSGAGEAPHQENPNSRGRFPGWS